MGICNSTSIVNHATQGSYPFYNNLTDSCLPMDFSNKALQHNLDKLEKNSFLTPTWAKVGLALAEEGGVLMCAFANNEAACNLHPFINPVGMALYEGEDLTDKIIAASKQLCSGTSSFCTSLALAQCTQKRWSRCMAGLAGSWALGLGCSLLPDGTTK
jgi:hypothetical protein